MELLGVTYEEPDNDPLDNDLQMVMEHEGVAYSPDSQDYAVLKSNYKFAKRSYLRELIEYNQSVADFRLVESGLQSSAIKVVHNPEHNIHALIQEYLKEDKKGLNLASHKEKTGSLRYLIDWLGQDCNIAKINGEKAREVKGRHFYRT